MDILRTPVTLLIEDPTALPADIWQALAEVGIRADLALTEALRRRDLPRAEACLAAAGPEFVRDRPGLLAPWYEDQELRAEAGPRLLWALWLDGRCAPPPVLPPSQGVDRLLMRALRALHGSTTGWQMAPASMASAVVRLRDLPAAHLAELGPWAAFLRAQCAGMLLSHGQTESAASMLSSCGDGLEGPGGREIEGLRALVEAVRGDIPGARRRLRMLEGGQGRTPASVVAAEAIVAVEEGRLESARRAIESAGVLNDDHLLAAETLLLVAERRLERAASRYTLLPVEHPLRAALTGVFGSRGSADAPRLVTGLDSTVATPRSRLRRALERYVAARRLGFAAVSTAAAQSVAELVRAYGLSSPLLLLSTEDARSLGEATGLAVQGAHDETSLLDRLSTSERAVLDEMILGGTEAQIARRLFRSVNTVRTQRRSLYRKLNVDSRREAIALALATGWDSAQEGPAIDVDGLCGGGGRGTS